MNKKISTALKFLFSCLLVIFLIWKSQPKTIWALMASSKFIYLYLALFFYLLIIVAGIYRWKLLLSQIAVKSSLAELTKLTLLSQFGNVFIPGGFWGDLMRGMKIKKDGSASKCLASVFIDRVLGAFGFVLIGFFLLPFASHYLNRSLFTILLALFLAIIVITVLIFFNGTVQRLIVRSLSSDKKPIQKMKQFYLDLLVQMNHNKALILKALAVSLIASFINILVFYFISYSLGNSAAPMYFFLFIPIIIVLSHLPVSYQGLGLREAGFIVLFASAGLNRSQSLSISLLYFGLIVVMAALSGIAYFVWNQLDKKTAAT